MFDYFLLLGLLFALVAVFLLSIYHLKWSVFLISVLLPFYLFRLNISWIPTTFLELSLYIVLIVAASQLILHLIKAKSKKQAFLKMLGIFWKKIKWLHLLILLFLITAVLGVIISDDKQLSLGILKAWFIDPIIYFYLIIFILDKRRDLRKLFYLIISPAIILAFYGLFQYLTGNLLPDGRVRIFYESPNYVSLYFGPLIIICLGLFFYNLWLKKDEWRLMGRLGITLGLGLSLILMGIILFLTKSYAAWLAVFFGVLIVGSLIPRLKWVYWTSILGSAVIGFITQIRNPKFTTIFELVGPSSMHKRVEIWQVSFKMITDNWLEGIGLGKFQDLYERSSYLVFVNPLESEVLHSHNLFLYFWLNLGVTGFLTFLGILACLIYCFIKIARDKQFFNKIRLEYFVLLGMFAMIVVHGLLDTPYWKNDLAMLFWIVAAGVVWLYNFKPNKS